MSAILETEPGGELVCIGRFSAAPKDAPDGSKARRIFRIGERVRYAGYYLDERLRDNPAGWMVVFETTDPGDPGQYAASQTDFVTPDDWVALKNYFADRTMSEPQAGRLTAKEVGRGSPS